MNKVTKTNSCLNYQYLCPKNQAYLDGNLLNKNYVVSVDNIKKSFKITDDEFSTEESKFKLLNKAISEIIANELNKDLYYAVSNLKLYGYNKNGF